MARRREIQVFNLSMLDIMACALGAMILLFIATVLRIRHGPEPVDADSSAPLKSIVAETRRLDDESERVSAAHRSMRERDERATRSLRSNAARCEHAVRAAATARARTAALERTVARLSRAKPPSPKPPSPPDVSVAGVGGLEWYHDPAGRRVRITRCEDPSPLADALRRAGLAPEHFDIVTVDGRAVSEPAVLFDTVGAATPGTPLPLTVRQDARTVELVVATRKQPAYRGLLIPFSRPGRLTLILDAAPAARRHVAALAARLLEWAAGSEAVSAIAVGDSPRWHREERGRWYIRNRARLIEAIRDDNAVSSRPLASAVAEAVEVALTEDAARSGDRFIVVSARERAGDDATIRRIVSAAAGHGVVVDAIVIERPGHGGSKRFLASVAEQTGGGFIGVSGT